MAKALGDAYPHLLSDVYLGSEYHGENCLHIAVVNRNVELVDWMLRVGDRGKAVQVDISLTPRVET